MLKKVRLDGGEAIQLFRSTTTQRGAFWGDDGFVYFSMSTGPVQRIPEDGGDPQPVTELRDQEENHRWPQQVHGSDVVLYTSFVEGAPEAAVIYAERPSTHERKAIASAASNGRFTHDGYVVFARPDGLMAVPFDPSTLEAGGPARPLGERARFDPRGIGLGEFALSENGVLVYRPSGERGRTERLLVWVDRTGQETPARREPATYRSPRIAPDGQQIAVVVTEPDGSTQIWVYDTVRGTFAKRTTEGTNEYPVWTPDGRRLTYSSGRADGSRHVYWRPADGSGAEEQLTSDAGISQSPNAWSADGTVLTIEDRGGGVSYVTMDGTPTRHPLLESAWNKDTPVISPDGRWLAYASSETGQSEIVVQPFPALDAKYVISSGGGIHPRWSGDSRQLFYLVDGENTNVMAVSLTTTPSFSASTATMLFEGPYDMNGYDVTADGTRFLMVRRADRGPDPPSFESSSTGPESWVNAPSN